MHRYLGFLLSASFLFSGTVFGSDTVLNEESGQSSSSSTPTREFKKGTIENLPDEILIEIAKQAQLTDVMALACASKGMKDVFNFDNRFFALIPAKRSYYCPSNREEIQKATSVVNSLFINQVQAIKYFFDIEILERIAHKKPKEIKAFEATIRNTDDVLFQESEDFFDVKDIIKALTVFTPDQIQGIGKNAAVFIGLDKDDLNKLDSFTPDQLNAMAAHFDSFFYKNRGNPVSIGNIISLIQTLTPDQIDSVGKKLQEKIQANPEKIIKYFIINRTIDDLFGEPDDFDD